MLKSYMTRMANGNAKHKPHFYESYDYDNLVLVSGTHYAPASFLVAELVSEGYPLGSNIMYSELARAASRFIYNPSKFTGDVLFKEVEDVYA